MVLNWKLSLLLAGLSLGLASEANAQSLTSGCWKMATNGHAADLCINVGSGAITGTMSNNGNVRNISGFWDGAARRIMFQATLQNQPDLLQVYEGYLSYDNVNNTSGPKRLSGMFYFFKGTGANSVTFQLGWTATRP